MLDPRTSPWARALGVLGLALLTGCVGRSTPSHPSRALPHPQLPHDQSPHQSPAAPSLHVAAIDAVVGDDILRSATLMLPITRPAPPSSPPRWAHPLAARSTLWPASR